MLKAVRAGLLAGTAVAMMSVSAIAADPYGLFERPSTGTQVQFYDCGGKLCGKVTKVKNPAKQKEVGTVILNGATKVGDNKWNGDLLNSEDGKTYTGHLTLVSPKELKLEGCALVVLCKGEVWQRVQ
jgi:uncharacterized protein (DUF2147 family)